MTIGRTPSRSSRTQRTPAHPQALSDLLRELDVRPKGRLDFKLVSRWAAKHVWRVDLNDKPWGYIRYLLGPADKFPERYRHMELGELLFDAHVGPRVLGITPHSDALGGRAAIVESALMPITRDELEARAAEAIALFSRLHSDPALLEALSVNLTEADLRGYSPLDRFFSETRERWFEAVVGRWLEVGLSEINIARQIVSELMRRLDDLQHSTESIGIIVPAHNDPNHGNFMVNKQGALRLIDFEELALSNPVADIGVFLVWYVDIDQHLPLLEQYPLADPQAMLQRMKVWVPLRYINIAAHWASRLTHAEEEQQWVFAVESVDEWLRGACELLSGGHVLPNQARRLEHLKEALMNRWPFVPPSDDDPEQLSLL